MVTQVFFSKKTPGWRVQPLLQSCTKVTLSEQAWVTLKLNQREKSAHFKNNLDDAWWKIDEATKAIAAAHSKSLCCVETDLHLGHGRLRSRRSKLNTWNTFCWKKCRENTTRNNENAPLKRSVLPTDTALAKDSQQEYQELSDDAKQHLIQEFAEFKETKTIGVHVSARSQINDVTQTLKVVENEICAAIHEIINHKLQEITRDLKVKMQWTLYFWNFIQCYMVTVIGWPDSIPFVNLSSVSSMLSQLEMLLCKWEMGTIYWKTLSKEEYNELRQKRNKGLKSGELPEALRHTHSDKGKKCSWRSGDLDEAPTRNKKYKSVETIEDGMGNPSTSAPPPPPACNSTPDSANQTCNIVSQPPSTSTAANIDNPSTGTTADVNPTPSHSTTPNSPHGTASTHS
ncbi:hypothetical protein HYDPIDRAFT_33108 [Hydnomerulius pinastri MD-312]|uniref:Uncharacterized protein n=1 Tax=Hydnomerulius pinastri MD-312 TaxID=994086 RepID=A0A0C9VP78_9AGAM|nr:hypothetical protein HYDPIDRAFT_33108 [Hydnomerulius pinastri MD-312]